MNQDQVKENLKKLAVLETKPFEVIFSGKQSKKVNGLYHPETCEIILHNKNFENDNQLMYTAIHEFAHHTGVHNHSAQFRSVFHGLLSVAEELGIYKDTISQVPELQEKVNRIRVEYLQKQAELLKAMGQELMEAEKLCEKHGARFEDFVERGLKISTAAATSAMKIKAMDIPTEIGPDNMKAVASIKNQQARTEAVEAMMEGDTPDQVKHQLKAKAPEDPESPTQLMREKKRIQAAMDRLADRLEQIDMILEDES